MTDITDAGRHLADKWLREAVSRDLIATQSIADKAALAKAKADLREAAAAIDDALPWMEAPKATSARQRARLATIAARHRETDPLVEALTALDTITGDMTRAEYAGLIRAELAKRGIEWPGVKP